LRFSVWLWSVQGCCRGQSGMHPLLFPWHMLPTVVDTAFRVPCPLRWCRQFALVFADISHAIFNRNNRFQSQTAWRTLEIPDHVFAYIQKNIVLQVPLAQYFPEYSGGTDVNKGAKYILWRFMQLNCARLNVYPQ
jgi:hypothetical protein